MTFQIRRREQRPPARLGAAARTTIAERFAPSVIGAHYRRRLEALALQGLPHG